MLAACGAEEDTDPGSTAAPNDAEQERMVQSDSSGFAGRWVEIEYSVTDVENETGRRARCQRLAPTHELHEESS